MGAVGCCLKASSFLKYPSVAVFSVTHHSASSPNVPFPALVEGLTALTGVLHSTRC